MSVLSGKATNINCMIFGLTRSGLEPTIYRTRGEHANHYATDAVPEFNGKNILTGKIQKLNDLTQQ